MSSYLRRLGDETTVDQEIIRDQPIATQAKTRCVSFHVISFNKPEGELTGASRNGTRGSVCLEEVPLILTPPGRHVKRMPVCGDSDFKVKYKTEVCKNWSETGTCEFGFSCAFAHGTHELRQKVHVSCKYKTKKCRRFHMTGYCSYGSRCQFLHDEDVLDTSSAIDQKGSKSDDCLQILTTHLPTYWALDSQTHSSKTESKSSTKRLPFFHKITSDSLNETLDTCESDLNESIEDECNEFKSFEDFKPFDSVTSNILGGDISGGRNELFINKNRTRLFSFY